MSGNVRPETMERITTPELAKAFIDEQVAAVRAQVGDKKVLLALSGGVDSSVVAALLIKAIGKQLTCVHVNHGLMRKGESEDVIRIFGQELDANLIYVDATDRFLDLLAGVSAPERKRKIIGAALIHVFADEASQLEGTSFRVPSTLIFWRASSRLRARRRSSLTTMWAVCLRICSLSWWSPSSFCSRMKSGL